MLHLSKTSPRQLSSLTCISGDTKPHDFKHHSGPLIEHSPRLLHGGQTSKGTALHANKYKEERRESMNSLLPEESFQHHVEISYTQLNARGLQMTTLASCSLTSRSLYPTLVTLFCARASISNNSSLHDKNSAQILRAIDETI